MILYIHIEGNNLSLITYVNSNYLSLIMVPQSTENMIFRNIQRSVQFSMYISAKQQHTIYK